MQSCSCINLLKILVTYKSNLHLDLPETTPSNVTLVPSMVSMFFKACTNLGGTGTAMVKSTGWNLGLTSVFSMVECVSLVSIGLISYCGVTSVVIVVLCCSDDGMYVGCGDSCVSMKRLILVSCEDTVSVLDTRLVL